MPSKRIQTKWLPALLLWLAAALSVIATLPAGAHCGAGHGTSKVQAMMAMPGMPRHAPAPADIDELCVGCVAPATSAAPVLTPPLPLMTLPAIARHVALAAPAPRAPDTPPPRLA